ncbi:hypothetical protein HF264_14610 [Rhizobium leguminosarum]|jgi:hypothetical protein|uniref:hypothetical protein n=1 Tax=Rhizobium leguminosarum TaxID=384 RepID=UPI001C92509A|nr:hypothetical protein [Rhizobium leguminosarum]MBY2940931.1 hypothetical protein [Rhizobium leguminosarum]
MAMIAAVTCLIVRRQHSIIGEGQTMTLGSRESLFDTVESAITLYKAASMAFLSIIEVLPMDYEEGSRELNPDLEEARYRIRAVIQEESNRDIELLDVIGE